MQYSECEDLSAFSAQLKCETKIGLGLENTIFLNFIICIWAFIKCAQNTKLSGV